MNYAVRKDGLGFRAVNGPDDIDQATETYSAAMPVPTAAQVRQQEWDTYRNEVRVALNTRWDGPGGVLSRWNMSVAQGLTTWQDAAGVKWIAWAVKCRGIIGTVTPPSTIPASVPAMPKSYPAGS